MDGKHSNEGHNMARIDPKADDSTFFELHPPPSKAKEEKLEYLAERLFSEDHLQFILRDHSLFSQLSVFVNNFMPQHAPTLVRYLEIEKALKAIEYANAVASKIRWAAPKDYYKVSRLPAATADTHFKEHAKKDLKVLHTEVLPAFITHNLVNIVVDCVTRDITTQAIPVIMDLVGKLAEVFCLTDPSLEDNPIIYASDG